MSRKKRFKIPFDSCGGVVVMSRFMLNHENYLTLPPQAKILMQLMQEQWRDEKEVDYGIREASEKIPCSRKTAMKAFDILRDRGFITLVDESLFSSRTNSKSRTWRLTWMPWMSRTPTHKWENWGDEKLNQPVYIRHL